MSCQSVQNWFEIIVDTLLGAWLPAWKLKRATKQVSHPKFYLFDSGVSRASRGRFFVGSGPAKSWVDSKSGHAPARI
ncbi:MAG: hypothetical protein ACKOEX_13010 [Planctomycetia bacterium]